ncbi:hypothetical protein [Campylobacter californiensis]|uniref:hypothetical protein n=1 Tax=Campylobacter californiensis TaxID=1032243 RepID=UPI001474DB47|nr:hypothetical protein [Campylobacter sp. RM12916]MBE3610504.1 hypothetical protein [Campylobacter sp. RM12916]
MIKTHSVDVELACKIGFNEANVLGFIAYWVKNNRDNNKNFYDGKYWTYNSVEALQKQFPYWTKRQIYGIIDKLESIGAIKKANYNKNKFDRTAWYSLDDSFMYLINSEMDVTDTEFDFTNSEMDVTQSAHPSPQNAISLKYQTNIKPIAKANSKPLTPLPPTQVLPDFLDPALWEQYLAYKKERKEKLSKQGIAMKFSEWAKWHSEGIDVNACIREAMRNEWQGVFKPKDKPQNQPNTLSVDDVRRFGGDVDYYLQSVQDSSHHDFIECESVQLIGGGQ